MPHVLMNPGSLGARAGSVLALRGAAFLHLFPHCLHAFQVWKLCPCAHLCSVALEPLEL